MGIVEQFIQQLNTERRKLKRTVAKLVLLSLVVVIGVSWNLRLTGVTLANDACCGISEHQHGEDCPIESTLVCTLPEGENLEEGPPVHYHDEDCYRTVYTCGYVTDHIHTIECYSDPSADVEEYGAWEASIPANSGIWANDLAAVAISQIGNAESERNFLVTDFGEAGNGISRYGQWYGNPYGDWSGMFLMFCLNYANIPQDAIAWSPGVDNMMALAAEHGTLSAPDADMASKGNIIFVDTDFNGTADKALIALYSTGDALSALTGDWDNAVSQIDIANDDSRILGYINVAALQQSYYSEPSPEVSPEPAPEVSPEPAPETTPVPSAVPSPEADAADPDEELVEEESPELIPDDQPDIMLDVEYLTDGTMRLFADMVNIDDAAYTWQWQVSADGENDWTDIIDAEGLIYILPATEENEALFYRLQGRKMQPMVFAMARSITVTDEDGGTISSGAISPYSIGKNGNVYTVDVYALPVDAAGNRISEIAVTQLNSITVNSSTKIAVKNSFDNNLGTYRSAYFGTESKPEKNDTDNIKEIWRYETGWTNKVYYLAYNTTANKTYNQYKNSAANNISLYLRYTPTYTVSYVYDENWNIIEKVEHGGKPVSAEPGTWTKENFELLGWYDKDDPQQTLYSFEEIQNRAVTKDVTYVSKWAYYIYISFDMGEYAQYIYPIDPIRHVSGETYTQLPTPVWLTTSTDVAFDGWYLEPDFRNRVTPEYTYPADTTLFARWISGEDGYFVYFMDFAREGQTPLVLMTSAVTEGNRASSRNPSNAPEGMEWDGKWYLDAECTIPFDFTTAISDMGDYLTGVDKRDLYLYPGTQQVCRAIFITYGSKIDPVTVLYGESINLDDYVPERTGYEFAGWTLKDGTAVSGVQQLTETTSYYATWEAGYVPFEAILRIENANDTAFTQAKIQGTWYAMAGSQIRVKSTYTGTGDKRTGTHSVVCVLDGVEYPVYTDASLRTKATLADVYSTYFVYNNTGTTWTDEVNWDDVYTGGEVPYSTRPISSAGDTIINFDYMRVRNDIVFTIPSGNSGGYLDIYKLYNSGLITGSFSYSGTVPTKEGQNVSASGVSAQNIRWTYTANSNGNNYYTLHDMKYGQRIFEVYPVGGSWLTTKNAGYHQYKSGSGQLFSSRRQDLTSDFFSGSGRALTPYSLTAEFKNQEYIALMYAVECLEDEVPDFTIDGIGYKVRTELCEVVKHTGDYSIKDLDGCEPGVSANGTYTSNRNTYNKYYSAKINSNTNAATVMKNAKLGNTSVYTLFAETYWPYYAKFNGVDSITTFTRAYIFYYNRLHTSIQFNLGYDSNGDGLNDTLTYENIAFGEKIGEYKYAMPDNEKHPMLEREGYEFVGWLDSNGFVIDDEDWESMVASGSENSSVIFIAKWEKISSNIVEYYEDVSAAAPFESHYFDDGKMLQYPTMAAYPQGWVWQEYGEDPYQRFDWDVPMYGEYGVREMRINTDGEEVEVNVIRIYGTWDESHTRVVYDPNAAQGGLVGTAPVDNNEYTIWQSEVSVMSHSGMSNIDPEAIFVGWQLDRDGVIYHPGDHVPVRWPRTMIFTAQWAKPEEVVRLRYAPNGGTPDSSYPNDGGFEYRRNSTALVWDNHSGDGAEWFKRTGFAFVGWNTAPDGSGTAYAPGSNIQLTEPVTTLYAQWESNTHSFRLTKVDRENGKTLAGAVFDLYKNVGGQFQFVESHSTDSDGTISFSTVETAALYKLVESRPPNGYAIINREICFRINPVHDSLVLEFCDSSGNPLSTVTGISGDYNPGIRHLDMRVENIAGFALPATGGPGLLLHILCGATLVIAPFVYGFSLRRRRERRAAH